MFLPLVYPSLFHFISLSIQIHVYLLNPVFFNSDYFSCIHLYLFLFLVYPPPFIYTSLSIRIDPYLFLPFCQSKLTPISFRPIFFNSVYSLYIHIYLLLSLVYPTLFLYISLSIQIHVYLFQSHFLYLCLFFVYPPIFVAISCLYTSISLYLFVNPDWSLSLSTSLSIQINAYLFQPHVLHLCLFFVYPPIFVAISCPSNSISLYLFVNLDSRLSLSIPFSLPLSILCICTYICCYLLSIHLYLFIPLCQSGLIPIPFYLFANSNSRLYLLMFFSLFQYISHLFDSITFYLCTSPSQSGSTPISFNPCPSLYNS